MLTKITDESNIRICWSQRGSKSLGVVKVGGLQVFCCCVDFEFGGGDGVVGALEHVFVD
jgi:hypothetical protein